MASVLTRTLLETNQEVPEFLQIYIPEGEARTNLKFEADSDFDPNDVAGAGDAGGAAWGTGDGDGGNGDGAWGGGNAGAEGGDAWGSGGGNAGADSGDAWGSGGGNAGADNWNSAPAASTAW